MEVYMTKSKYLCVGENFKIPVGNCGETKTLLGWLCHCAPNKDEDFIKDFFQYDSDKQICDYIYEHFGLRLKKEGR